MKNKIIAYVEKSDRNIYLTIEDGALVSVNYSQGEGDIDLNFMNQFDIPLFENVCEALDKEHERFSSEHFFPTPYWYEQIQIIDKAIWKHIERKNILEEIEELERKINKLKKSL